MSSTRIEWTEATWNPVTGCTKTSSGCQNCYAERMAKRLEAMGQPNYRNGFVPTCHPATLRLPLEWKRPQMVFVNSMSDLFHEDVPTEFIQQVFETMNVARKHRFQVLTKRTARLRKISKDLTWTDNIWMGATVEAAEYRHRIADLQATPAEVKFLSLEPLLGPLGRLDLKGIHWVIAGGESGPGARPMLEEWVLPIKAQCEKRGVAFFFKQWGGVQKKRAGRLLQGRTWDAMPAVATA